MSFFEGAQRDMFNLLDSINSTASQVSETMKTSFNNLEVNNILNETNEKMSNLFTQHLSETPEPSNGNHDNDGTLLRTSSSPTSAADTSDGAVSDTLPAFDESLPGYAQPAAYLEESEMCRQVVSTNRKLTEADLDVSDPLYCDRQIRESQLIEIMETDENSIENLDMFDDLAQCIRGQLRRLKSLVLEHLMSS